MEKFLQLLLSGVALGAIYAIVALGFVLVFKATSVLNFAHGSFLMLAGYLATTLLSGFDLPFLVGLAIIAVVLGVLGIVLHYSVMQWMLGKAFFSVVLVTVGMEIVIRAIILVFWGPLERGQLRKLPEGSFEVGGAIVTWVNVIIVIAAAIIVVAFLLVLREVSNGPTHAGGGRRSRSRHGDGHQPQRGLRRCLGNRSRSWRRLAACCTGTTTPSVNLGLSVIGLRAFPAAILGGIDSIQGSDRRWDDRRTGGEHRRRLPRRTMA